MKNDNLNKKEIIEKITPIIENAAINLNLVPIEVDLVKELDRWFLRIFVYSHDHVITHQDCEVMTRSLNDELDEFIPVDYFLEISSPGAERKLKSPKEYEIFKGIKVKIKLKQPIDQSGNKVIYAKILEYDEKGTLKVELADEKIEVNIDEKNISSARLCLDQFKIVDQVIEEKNDD